jgi:hypothetical protein
MFIPDPGSDFFPSRIPDPNCLHPGSRIRIKEFMYINPKKPKKWFLSSRKYDPGCSSLIRMLTFYPSWIRDPGVKKAPDPESRGQKGTGSWIRIRNTAGNIEHIQWHGSTLNRYFRKGADRVDGQNGIKQWANVASNKNLFRIPVLRIRDVYPRSRILIFTHSGSRIKKQLQKRGVKKFVVKSFFVTTNFTKFKIILFFKC